jgi:tRNA(Ile)-lysidine synthetase-like protein
MPTVAERFSAHLRRRRLFGRPGVALVAVSGGPDSLALLDLLAGVATHAQLRLVVAHVDHGIQPDSQAVATTVREWAARYGVPCESGRLELGPGASETLARRARYEWLEAARIRLGADWIVTAHHRDDQAETVLLRTLRGSALAGLAGMAARTRAGIVRPLLAFTRADLAAHLATRHIVAHQDAANTDLRHLRSWLRQTVLPLLEARLGPGVTGDLVRVARHAAADRQAWDALLGHLPGLDLRLEHQQLDVARAVLTRYDDVLVAAVLRAAARRVGLVLGPRRARRLVDLAGKPSGRRLMLGGGWMAEVAFDRLRIGRVAPAAPLALTPEHRRAGELAFGAFAVRWEPALAPKRLERAAWRTWLPSGGWELRPPRPGDVIVPLGGVGHRPLRRLLMEARVPRSERAAYPVVARRETILWVPGICRSAVELPVPGTEAVRVDVSHL